MQNSPTKVEKIQQQKLKEKELGKLNKAIRNSFSWQKWKKQQAMNNLRNNNKRNFSLEKWRRKWKWMFTHKLIRFLELNEKSYRTRFTNEFCSAMTTFMCVYYNCVCIIAYIQVAINFAIGSPLLACSQLFHFRWSYRLVVICLSHWATFYMSTTNNLICV